MEHPVHLQITNLLHEKGMWFEEFMHGEVRTSEDAAKVRLGYSLAQGAKALIVRAKIPNEGKRFVMLVMPADQKFDNGKVKALLRARDIRFATEDEVAQLTTGIKPGGVPPFGGLFGIDVLCDESLYRNEKIVFNAGRTSSIAMKSVDYRALVSPVVAVIV